MNQSEWFPLVKGLAALKLPRVYLGKAHYLTSHSTPTESESLDVGTGNLCF